MVVGLGLVAWIGTLLFDFGGDRVIRIDPAAIGTTGPQGLAPVELPVAQLVDYYEHGIEHAPPRDPSGVMQRREAHYTAPPADPFTLIRSKLMPGAGDAALRDWLDRWEAGWTKGERTDPLHRHDLQDLLPKTTLDAITLLEVGRSVNFLDGDEHAAYWYRAGIDRAVAAYANASPTDPSVKPLLALLDQTKALWRRQDHATLERRFALAMRLNPPLSPEARRAGYLNAEAVFAQGYWDRAADLMLGVQARHERAGDLGAAEKGDVHEMAWVLGLMCDQAGRHADAIRHLDLCLHVGGEHRSKAMVTRFWALLAEGRVAEAERQIEEYVASCSPPRRVAEAMRAAVEGHKLAETIQ